MDTYEQGQNTNKLLCLSSSLFPSCSLAGVLLLTAGHIFTEDQSLVLPTGHCTQLRIHSLEHSKLLRVFRREGIEGVSSHQGWKRCMEEGKPQVMNVKHSLLKVKASLLFIWRVWQTPVHCGRQKYCYNETLPVTINSKRSQRSKQTNCVCMQDVLYVQVWKPHCFSPLFCLIYLSFSLWLCLKINTCSCAYLVVKQYARSVGKKVCKCALDLKNANTQFNTW